MSKKSFLMLAATVGVMMATTVHANEWDNVSTAPQGLVVRINEATGQREVFRADTVKATSVEQAQAIANNVTTADNMVTKITDVERTSEYDAPGITKEAWYYYWGWGGWGGYWGGYYGYYNYYYYPSYSWYWGGYRYGYYCW